jgi:hypothetical protein
MNANGEHEQHERDNGRSGQCGHFVRSEGFDQGGKHLTPMAPYG